MDGWLSDDKIEVWTSATDGETHIELNTDALDVYDDAANIYQTVNTVDGADYTLTFDYAGRPGYDASVNAIEVVWDGDVVETLQVDASMDSDYNWQTFSTTIEGDGDPTKVEIREVGVDQSYGRGMHLDNITLEETIDDGAHGEAGEAIDLPDITAALTDTDGSETLAVSLTNLAEGTVLTDGTNTITIGADGESGDISGWDLTALQATTTSDVAGTSQINVEATSTETVNGDSETTTGSFNLTVDNEDQTIMGTEPTEGGGSGTINVSNWSDTSSGYTVTAQNIEGGVLTEASAANIDTWSNGLGASGTVAVTDSWMDNQLSYDTATGQSETVVIDFDNDVSSASFDFQHLYTAGFGDQGQYTVYNDDNLGSSSNLHRGFFWQRYGHRHRRCG